MIKFFKWLQNIIVSKIKDTPIEDQFKISLNIFSFLFAFFIFLIFAIIHIFDKNYTELIINFSTSFVMFMIFLLIIILKKNLPVIIFGSSLFIIAVSILFYIGGKDGSRIFWYYFVPFSCISLIGKKWGYILCGLSFGIFIILFFKIPIVTFQPYPYPPIVLRRFLISYSILIVILITFDKIRLYYIKKLTEERHKLLLANESILKLSITDPLTKSYNRAHFNEVINKEFLRTKRYDIFLSILMCDIDHFKQINDIHGHMIGDEVLKKFTNILFNSIRKDIDTVYRYGGEEFIVILPQTNYKSAEKTAFRIRKIINYSLKKYLNISKPITASMGVVTIDSKYTKNNSIDDLMRKVDELLYSAKKSGRDKIVCMKL